ncbi:PBECR3 domain-containing polyvalent protein [Spirosoma validum]|uniref:Phage-Barnase-EndoU-ColicinE5/D-RelE like nuclease 3 domain-containing protein n=1 Tax=Spirosoma validum TaxID=2771355 RepID=A0A927AXU8_9BACT|nr:hypothetical protein [Spirosoma validum]MBD2751753.1 hypothetical protein [Spirosoma validum]
MQEGLSEFIKESLRQSLPENKQIILGTVPDSIVQQVVIECGIDLTNYMFTIDTYAIRHIMKSHGNPQKKEARGQKAITTDDFELIYQIINDSDVVFYDGKNRIGREVIQFQKRIGDRYIILKEVRNGRKQLALNSMRIIKIKRNQD